MDEYIEREEIRRAYEKLTRSYVNGNPYIADWRFDEMIGKLPAADVAPVRHGRWEIVIGSNGNEYMVCTCCRVSQDLTGVFTYCPNCGCRMDRGDDE